jgi:hypothetical protein
VSNRRGIRYSTWRFRAAPLRGRLDLARVALVELRHLVVVGRLADRPEPGPQVGLELVVAHVARERGPQVGGDRAGRTG